MLNLDDVTKRENFTGKMSVNYSDNMKYMLEISWYSNGKPEDHYWDYSRGRLFGDPNGELYFDIWRNYPSFWYLFIKHPNGNDYLLCGRDYHGGYSIFDLTNKQEYIFQPDHSNRYVQYFCWANAEFDQDTQKLRVEGCYWGAPYEIVIFDFSDPTNIPLLELSREYCEGSDN